MGPATAIEPRVRQYADPFACPACAGRLPLEVTRCPQCHLVLDGLLARQLLQTLRIADNQLAQLVAASRRQVEPDPMPAPTVPPPLPPAPEHRGLSDVTVPRLLLGLGALCLLVAALIFLAVAWTWLGVGGRTTVLVGLTLVTGGAGVLLTRRDLRVAGEALTTVALGLLALDVIGAYSAGWLGDRSPAGVVAAIGLAVLAAALPLSLSTRLVSPQLIAATALSALGLGWLVVSGHETATTGAVILGYAGLTTLGGVRRLVPLVAAAAAGAGTWWLGLTLHGLQDAVAHPSLSGLWVDRWGVPLLVASLLLLLPIAFTRHHAGPTRAVAATAATLLTIVAILPAVDETATTAGAVALGALVAWGLVSRWTPRSWLAVPLAPLALCAVPVLVLTAALAVQAVTHAVAYPADRLGDPDPVAAPILLLLGAAGLVGALDVVVRVPQRGFLLAAAGIGVLALHPVPVWTVVAALVVLGVAITAGRTPERALAGTGVVALGTVVALPSDPLAAVTLVVLLGLATGMLRDDSAERRLWGGLMIPVGLGALVWIGLGALGVAETSRAVPVLLALGLVAILRPRPESELAAAMTGAAAATASVSLAADASVALAVHLTVAGVVVCVSALVHRDRVELRWLGGLLLATATWVRLADIGVTAPEPYTLPSALVLVAVGLIRMGYDREATTMRALGPGLLLATVPSLLWVLVDPVTVRAAVLGVACLGLVLVGVHRRWNAPLVVGAGVGTVIVLVELAPYAAEIPQWVLIGLAGTVLTLVGITWERRLRDLHSAREYVERLR